MTHPLPQNWQEVTLGDLFTFKNGVNAGKASYGSGSPFINVMEVINNTYLTAKKIPGKVNLESKALEENRVIRGDILFNRTSETQDEIALSSVYLDDAPVVFGGFVIRGRSKNRELIDSYKKYCFRTNHFRSLLIKSGQGAVRSNIGQKDLVKLPFQYPSKDEQHRIVTVLEAWDKVIERMERKFELKKNFKKGLMQQLLTGKMRLPGFSGEWKEVKLGDVCKIKTGKKDNKDKIKNGQYPFFVRSPNIERIDTYSYEGEAILVPGEGNIGNIFHYINGKFDVHQRVYKISDFSEKVLGKYIYYYLFHFFGKHALKSSVKATVDSLRLPMFTEFIIRIPSKDEQDAIAKIIGNANQENEYLQSKLQKFKDQKTYLLNNLITGRIPTPETMPIS